MALRLIAVLALILILSLIPAAQAASYYFPSSCKTCYKTEKVCEQKCDTCYKWKYKCDTCYRDKEVCRIVGWKTHCDTCYRWEKQPVTCYRWKYVCEWSLKRWDGNGNNRIDDGELNSIISCYFSGGCSYDLLSKAARYWGDDRPICRWEKQPYTCYRWVEKPYSCNCRKEPIKKCHREKEAYSCNCRWISVPYQCNCRKEAIKECHYVKESYSCNCHWVSTPYQCNCRDECRYEKKSYSCYCSPAMSLSVEPEGVVKANSVTVKISQAAMDPDGPLYIGIRVKDAHGNTIKEWIGSCGAKVWCGWEKSVKLNEYGKYYVVAWATGNEFTGPSKTVAIELQPSDKSPPVIWFYTSGGTYIGYRYHATVHAGANDNYRMKKVEVYIDGGFFGSTSCNSRSCGIHMARSFDPGDHRVKITAWDWAGNKAEKTYTIHVEQNDLEKPSVSLHPPSGTFTVVGNYYTLNVKASASDDVRVATVKIFLDGKLAVQKSCSSKTCTLTGFLILDGGKHYVKAVATDWKGKQSWITYVYTINTIEPNKPPSVSLSPSGGNLVTSGEYYKLTVTASATDDRGLDWIKIRSGSFNVYKECRGKTCSMSAKLHMYPGTNTVTVIAKDTDGATAQKSYTFEVTRNYAPSVSVSPSGTFYTTKTYRLKVKASATDDYGVRKIGLFVNDRLIAQKDCSGRTCSILAVESLGIGSYTIKAVAEDVYGVSAESSGKVVIKRDYPPSIGLKPDGTAEASALPPEILITATAEDDLGVSGLQVKVDGKTVSASACGSKKCVLKKTAELEPGEHFIMAIAYDSAGQAAMRSTKITLLKPEPPEVSLRVPPKAVTVGEMETVNVEVSASDNHRIEKITVYLDGNEVLARECGKKACKIAGKIAVPLGSHVITAVAEDDAGHRKESARSIEVLRTLSASKLSASYRFRVSLSGNVGDLVLSRLVEPDPGVTCFVTKKLVSGSGALIEYSCTGRARVVPPLCKDDIDYGYLCSLKSGSAVYAGSANWVYTDHLGLKETLSVKVTRLPSAKVVEITPVSASGSTWIPGRVDRPYATIQVPKYAVVADSHHVVLNIGVKTEGSFMYRLLVFLNGRKEAEEHFGSSFEKVFTYKVTPGSRVEVSVHASPCSGCAWKTVLSKEFTVSVRSASLPGSPPAVRFIPWTYPGMELESGDLSEFRIDDGHLSIHPSPKLIDIAVHDPDTGRFCLVEDDGLLLWDLFHEAYFEWLRYPFEKLDGKKLPLIKTCIDHGFIDGGKGTRCYYAYIPPGDHLLTKTVSYEDAVRTWKLNIKVERWRKDFGIDVKMPEKIPLMQRELPMYVKVRPGRMPDYGNFAWCTFNYDVRVSVGQESKKMEDSGFCEFKKKLVFDIGASPESPIPNRPNAEKYITVKVCDENSGLCKEKSVKVKRTASFLAGSKATIVAEVEKGYYPLALAELDVPEKGACIMPSKIDDDLKSYGERRGSVAFKLTIPFESRTYKLIVKDESGNVDTREIKIPVAEKADVHDTIYCEGTTVAGTPKVRITYPLDGMSFDEAGYITVKAKAWMEGDGEITKVVFIKDGSPLWTDKEAPYEAKFYFACGEHVIEAKAYSSTGKTATDSVKIRVCVVPTVTATPTPTPTPTPPCSLSVKMTSIPSCVPEASCSLKPIEFKASSTSMICAVKKVELYVNGEKVDEKSYGGVMSVSDEFDACAPVGAKPGDKLTVKVVAVGADGQRAEDTRKIEMCSGVRKHDVYVAYDIDPRSGHNLFDYLVYIDGGKKYVLGKFDLLTRKGEIYPPVEDTGKIVYVDYEKRIGEYIEDYSLLKLTRYPYCTYRDYFTVKPGITVNYSCET